MVNLGLLALRLTVGSLLAGHGAQKLFGAFGGHGLEGTAGMMHSLGFRPGKQWATLAGAAEFGGGLLSALGFLNPLGPLWAMPSMIVAAVKAHGGKPIWVTEGGAELPLTNMAALTAMALAGPGAFSVDRLFGIRLPRWFNLLALAGGAAFTVASIRRSNALQQQDQARDQAESTTELRVSEPVSAAAAPAAETSELTEAS